MSDRTFKTYDNIAELIKRARVSAGISQNIFADLLGYKNGQFISNLERGTAALPYDKVIPVSNVLGIDAETIKSAILKDVSDHIDRGIKETLTKGN